MRNALIVLGSPRPNGNTRALVDWIVQGMTEDDSVSVEIVDAAHIDTQAPGCTSCMACQEGDRYGCAIDDDLSRIVARMLEADIIVLASPLYWFGLSAQAKAVLDRMFALSKDLTPHPHVRGAAIALAVTAGGSEAHSGYQPLEDQFRRASTYLTGREGPMLFAFDAPMDADRDAFLSSARESGLLARATAFGRRLAAPSDPREE